MLILIRNTVKTVKSSAALDQHAVEILPRAHFIERTRLAIET